MSQKNAKLKPIGWNLTNDTKNQLYKIAAYFRTKRTQAVIKLIEILFSELHKDKDFMAFAAAYDRLHDESKDKSSYTSFYIPADYIDKFETTMVNFGFIDRSPFLRLIINYIYNTRVNTIEEGILPKVEGELKDLGYNIKSLGPILNQDIYIHIKKPDNK